MFDVNSFSVIPTTTPSTDQSIYVMSNEKYSNINQMDNYQAASETGLTSGDKFIESVTSVDFNYDYSQIPMNYDTKSFWQELAEPVQEVGGYAWDTATGAWTSVKESVVSAGESIYNVVDSAGGAVTSKIEGFFDMIKTNILYAVIIALIVLWVVAKSGILKQAAGLIKP